MPARWSGLHLLAAVGVAAMLLAASSAVAAPRRLLWDASTAAGVAGYRVHYGTASRSYDAHVDVGGDLSWTMAGLAPETTYYFAVTAYDFVGGESGYSAELQYATAPLSETVTSPGAPEGPAAGVTAVSYVFSTQGAVDSAGDPVLHRFHWGDGTVSDWVASTPASAAKTWDTAGSYQVVVEAACALHPEVGAFSAALAVRIDPRNPLLFSDDFSDGTAGGDPQWRAVSGAWRVAGSSRSLYSPAASNTACLARPVSGISSGRMETRFRLTRTSATAPNAGMVFAYRGGAAYRYVTLTNRRVTVGQVGATAAEAGGVKRSVAKSLPVGTWCHLRVDLRGDGTVRVYVNRATTPAVSYRFKDTVAGRVGYLSAKAQSAYDNFALWDATVLP